MTVHSVCVDVVRIPTTGPGDVSGLMALIDGREFRSNDDEKAPGVAIVNQAFTQRYFPSRNSVGRKFWLNRRDNPAGVEIVGEIANGRTDDLTQAPSPDAVKPDSEAASGTVPDTSGTPLSLSPETELRTVPDSAASEPQQPASGSTPAQ